MLDILSEGFILPILIYPHESGCLQRQIRNSEVIVHQKYQRVGFIKFNHLKFMA